jgi:hypothetical protein
MAVVVGSVPSDEKKKNTLEMSVRTRKPVLPIRLMSDLTYWLQLTAGAEIDCRFDVWPYLLTQTESRRWEWLSLTDSDCPPTLWLTRADWLGLPADTETARPPPPYTLPFPPNRDQTYLSYSFNFFFKFQENLYRICRVFGGWKGGWKGGSRTLEIP